MDTLTKVKISDIRERLTDIKRQIRDKSKNLWLIEDKVNGSDPYALYHCWIGESDKIKNGEKAEIKRRIKGGHRYYFLICMAIYAVK
jgi:hypothetical protein